MWGRSRGAQIENGVTQGRKKNGRPGEAGPNRQHTTVRSDCVVVTGTSRAHAPGGAGTVRGAATRRGSGRGRRQRRWRTQRRETGRLSRSVSRAVRARTVRGVGQPPPPSPASTGSAASREPPPDTAVRVRGTWPASRRARPRRADWDSTDRTRPTAGARGAKSARRARPARKVNGLSDE